MVLNGDLPYPRHPAHRACQHDASARMLQSSRAKVLIRLGKISNFTDREGNDVREAPHHSPR